MAGFTSPRHCPVDWKRCHFGHHFTLKSQTIQMLNYKHSYWNYAHNGMPISKGQRASLCGSTILIDLVRSSRVLIHIASPSWMAGCMTRHFFVWGDILLPCGSAKPAVCITFSPDSHFISQRTHTTVSWCYYAAHDSLMEATNYATHTVDAHCCFGISFRHTIFKVPTNHRHQLHSLRQHGELHQHHNGSLCR